MPSSDPHAGQPVFRLGPAPPTARSAMILLHGRGGGAEDILGLAAALNLPQVAFLAPQAAGHTWYPNSFLSPLDSNQPGIESAFGVIARLLAELEAAGLAPERIGLLGFSQGACLTLEFSVRHPRRFAAIVAFSGGLIGPPGTPRDYAGSLEGTPAFLGCSDTDPHIPLARVHESTAVLQRMGAQVTERIYPRLGHTVNRDELDAVRELLS